MDVLPKKSKSLLSRSQHLIARDTEMKLLQGLNALVDESRKLIQERTKYNAIIMPIISTYSTIYDQDHTECKEHALRTYASETLTKLSQLKTQITQMETLVEETVHLLFSFPDLSNSDKKERGNIKSLWEA